MAERTARARRQPARKSSVTIEDLTARNLATVMQVEEKEHARRNLGDRTADGITAFCGSMWFVCTHVVWFGAWIVINVRPQWAFDPFPFPFLTLVVSLEAIFLATFILISQNRQARIGDRRNLLDLQIDLLAEQESTKLLTLLTRIAEKVGVEMKDAEAAALEQATRCDRLVKQIERTLDSFGNGKSHAPGERSR
jgi:uncharacterized membrane protein